MSLINKMLQDLDKRGASPEPAGGKIREVEPIEMREETKGRGAIYAGAAVVVVALLGAGYWFFGPRLMRDDRVAMQPTKPAAPTPQPVKPAESPPTVSAPAPAPVSAPAPEKAQPEAAPVATTERAMPPAPAQIQPVATAKSAEPGQTVKPTVPEPAAKAASAPAVTEKASAPTKVAIAMPAAKEELAKASAPMESKQTMPSPPPTAVPKRAPERAPERAPVVQATVPQPVMSDSFKGNISIERQGRPAPPQQRAAVDYRTGLDYMNQGRVDQAIATFTEVLGQDPRHYAARQAQVTLLLERGRTADAQRSLREGLAALPETSSWAMLLARLQVEDGDAAGATDTLKKYLGAAQNRGDYQAFLGTVLQLQGRHQEAIPYYEAATKLSPGYGAWFTGLAMSLEEEKRTPEAVDAYKRASASNTLAPSMRSFVEGKLKQLQ